MQRSIVIAAALALAVCVASAHHPFSVIYDAAKSATITGTIATVEWRNPHVVVALDVNTAAGSERYMVEGYPPNTLQRQGWTQEMLRPGSRISILGWHARDAALKVFSGYEVTFADGSKRLVGTSPEGGDRWQCTGDCPTATWVPTFVAQ